MASVMIKFRLSTVAGKEGALYWQVIHKRTIRTLATDYRLYACEWDERTESIVAGGERADRLRDIQERLDWDYTRWDRVLRRFERSRREYTADNVIKDFAKTTRAVSLSAYMGKIIGQLLKQNRVRTAETYAAALKSFMSFREGEDTPIDGFSSPLMLRYEAHLKANGLCRNSTSFYMRSLRAVYNRAVEDGLVEDCHPFRPVYTGVDKTVKRAVPVKIIKAIKELDLTGKKRLDFARDMFMFSFYTRGMSFIDMAYLRKQDVQNGVLTYCRRKTGQRLTIKWERCMQDIIDKYPANGTRYLLPIITMPKDERKQYDNAMHNINYHLKRISEILDIPHSLTMYVARHSWASVAKCAGLPLSVISEGMGHDSEQTTQIYLASLETSVVDRANKKILGLL